jgi:hypothetical protein
MKKSSPESPTNDFASMDNILSLSNTMDIYGSDLGTASWEMLGKSHRVTWRKEGAVSNDCRTTYNLSTYTESSRTEQRPLRDLGPLSLLWTHVWIRKRFCISTSIFLEVFSAYVEATLSEECARITMREYRYLSLDIDVKKRKRSTIIKVLQHTKIAKEQILLFRHELARISSIAYKKRLETKHDGRTITGLQRSTFSCFVMNPRGILPSHTQT